MSSDPFGDQLAYQGARSGGGGLAAVVILLVLLFIVMLVITIIVMVKLINLVIRVYVRYGRISRALWLWLIVWIGLLVGTFASGASAANSAATSPTNQPDPVSLSLTGYLATAWFLVTIGLLIYCRIVEVRHEQFFQPEPEKGLRAVIKRPWWQPVGN